MGYVGFRTSIESEGYWNFKGKYYKERFFKKGMMGGCMRQ